MATKKIQSVTSLKNLHSDELKTLGHVKTYDGIYEAVVVNAKDIQKNGRLVVRLVGTNIKITDLKMLYIELNSSVYYDNTKISNADSLKTSVTNSLTAYGNSVSMNKFGGRFKYSNKSLAIFSPI